MIAAHERPPEGAFAGRRGALIFRGVSRNGTSGHPQICEYEE
jgi:hypothetical protein